MTDRLIAQCLTCERWRSPLDEPAPPAPDAAPACDAYPAGIPDPIWWNHADHRQAQQGDQGLQWASRDGATFPAYVLDLAPAPAALLDLATSRERLDVLDRVYKRNNDGEFSSGGGGTDHGNADGEDENVGAGDDEGAFGFGHDPQGHSYTEFDVNEDGSPRVSAAYREKYGQIMTETGPPHCRVVITSKGSLQIADDSAGSQHRSVVQEFRDKPKELEDIGTAIYEVHSGERSGYTSKSGVHVEPGAGTSSAGHDVDVTWSGGHKTTLSASPADLSDAFTVQEALDGIADTYRSDMKEAKHADYVT